MVGSTPGYPARRSMSLPAATAAAIDAAAEADGVAVGVILRRCIERGWLLVRDSRRKRPRRAAAAGGA